MAASGGLRAFANKVRRALQGLLNTVVVSTEPDPNNGMPLDVFLPVSQPYEKLPGPETQPVPPAGE